MKTTGVIRRIDELGRIVIPKEIRKRLRIREGDSIEIFVDNSEYITLKKYSLFSGLEDSFNEICKTLEETLQNTTLIVTKDEVVVGFGKSYMQFQNAKISAYLRELIDNRKAGINNGEGKIIENQMLPLSFAYSPIVSSGDVFGAIIVLADSKTISNSDLDIINVIARILARQQEV